MTKTVYYLIEQLWTDSMENTTDGAVGYSPFGIAPTEEIAKRVVDWGGMVQKQCWAMSGPMPKLRYKPLPMVEMLPGEELDLISLHNVKLPRASDEALYGLIRRAESCDRVTGYPATHGDLVSALRELRDRRNVVQLHNESSET